LSPGDLIASGQRVDEPPAFELQVPAEAFVMIGKRGDGS
jgi:hypothetical protein